MNTATINRDTSYHQLTDLGEKQAAVLRVIAERGPLFNRAIAEALGWDVNRVTPRVFELREKGLVAEAGVTFDSETGRNVTLWATRYDETVPPANVSPDALRAARSRETPLTPVSITPNFENSTFELKARATKALARSLVEADRAARDAGLTGYWIDMYRRLWVAGSLTELEQEWLSIGRNRVSKYPNFKVIETLKDQKEKELQNEMR